MAGFASERWTLRRIAMLIERELGMHYLPSYLERPLEAHGFSVQRPATWAKERDWVDLEIGAAGAPKASLRDEIGTASRPDRARPRRGAGQLQCCGG